MSGVQVVALHQAARERYLNYALSVITSRALPDVRDGLKPVQRRILYTMFHDMALHPSGRYRKCAAVVGEVMGKYHPHGDQSVYDALVRMAQDFSLRSPLVDGQGNFGSLDGDPAAAMRYTECRLRPLAEELLSEIRKRTVDYRPNYDGQLFEPIVLPAQFPQLLVNGCDGIAVGMATRIPPHNLGEVVDATVALIDHPHLSSADLVHFLKGPDFPTGGRILTDQADLIKIYENGQGTFRVRAQYSIEKEGRQKRIIIDSVPYGQNKSRLIEKIGTEVRNRKLPMVVDVRDESTDDVRIVLDLKSTASPEAVMAYLFRRTSLECSWSANLTVLVPSEERNDIAVPARLDLKQILEHWLRFRFETVRRRFEYDLQKLLDRIHILEGFASVFDCLDECIAIIRASEGRRDAHEKIMDRFGLTDIQAEAILELKLYRLAKLEILLIREELEEKSTDAARIKSILASDKELWKVVRSELLEIQRLYADERRTEIGRPEKELEFSEDAYIVKEDTFVIVTRDGWFKRQTSFSDISKIRVREEDEIGWLIKCHTRSTIAFFSSAGAAYVVRVQDVPATTGYGEPLQRHFNFTDGERVCGVISHDARYRENLQETLLAASGDDPPPPWGIAMTAQGRVLRFPLKSHEEPSTRSGRRYARLVGPGDGVVAVYPTNGAEKACVATKQGRAMLFPVGETAILRASGKGNMGIKLRPEDEVLAFDLALGSLDGPEVVTAQGRSLVVRERKFGISKRGGRGRVVLKRGSIDTWARPPMIQDGEPSVPLVIADEEGEA
ncbi:MAG: DNA topoisomerase IV subunit A [Proteobacteria bacterium]|jgi:DNA gyrase subunit A|nr:DNA topoisomerase IV subunit A [Pseudomonadota bacterium]